jgi:Uma2 family endonuclease
MATALLKKRKPKRARNPLAGVDNLAELLDRLGNVPLERVRFGPGFGSATEEDVIRLLEAPDKRICELIDGVLVEKPMGFKESTIASLIIQHIWNFLDEDDLGIAFSPDAPIRVKPGRIRFPDTGFISWKHFPNEEFPEDKVLDIMADLVVEVLSESNTAQEIDRKLDDYFTAGASLVWIVDPKTESVAVYTARHSMKTLSIHDTLEGGKVLPGFELPIKKLFARIHHRKKKR